LPPALSALLCPASEPPSSSGAFFCAPSVISYAKPAACRSETASRFARDLIVAETGFRRLRNAGITLIAADAPNSFLDDTPTSAFIRQVLAAVQELDKAMIVSKLRGARQRKRSTGVKFEGRKNYAQAVPLRSIAPRRLRPKA
jgi:DNA invertase Pin-like site-specific DNA recombinase